MVKLDLSKPNTQRFLKVICKSITSTYYTPLQTTEIKCVVIEMFSFDACLNEVLTFSFLDYKIHSA